MAKLKSNSDQLTFEKNYDYNNNIRSLRILIFSESFYPYTSGISRRFIEIITRLAKKSFRIHVVTGTRNPDGWIKNDEEIRSYVTFGCLKSIAFEDKIDCTLPFLFPQFGILTEILKFKPHIIHVVEHTPASMLCGIIAKSLDIPLICSSHTHIDSYIPLFIHQFAVKFCLKVYRYIRKSFLTLANCNLTVSSDFVHLLTDSGINSNIHVWKTGVDSELFNPIYQSHDMRLKMFNGHYSEDKLLFVSVGRISPEKNFEFLMKIIEKFSNIFLCIVGDGPYREEIKKLFPKDRTNFIGFLEGEELASAYASADYFIYASVSETFGQVYLEAMSSGIPVVAAEGKQMREFFINSQHGYTWRPGDENSAYEAIKNAMENHERISKNCRSNALKHSWNSSADQIINLYSQFVNHKSNRNVFTMTFRSIYYFMKWLFLMFLCLFFMAPFLTRKSIASNASRSPIDLNKFLFFHNFITKKVYTESNRVCRTFLATLSAVCLSLIFTSIYVMCNGKMSVNYFITFLN